MAGDHAAAAAHGGGEEMMSWRALWLCWPALAMAAEPSPGAKPFSCELQHGQAAVLRAQHHGIDGVSLSDLGAQGMRLVFPNEGGEHDLRYTIYRSGSAEAEPSDTLPPLGGGFKRHRLPAR